MLSFRDGVQQLTRERLLHELSLHLQRAASSRSALLAALLRAGELEALLEDHCHRSAPLLRELSDELARAWLGGSTSPLLEWQRRLPGLPLPDTLRLVRPEGYAYYGLDPAAYARASCERSALPAKVAVVGIRSIGTSLSAVVRAALERRGVPGERITVRPQGHPWDRKLEPSPELERFVQRWSEAHFLVVDEGPGLSGSTFLAAGEALERAGIPLARIELITSHPPNPERLLAREGARRWRRFHVTSIAQPELPAGARDLSGGAWRQLAYATEREWPACDVQLERRKYLDERGQLHRFAGLPPYDERALEHAERLASAGYCPPVVRGDHGFAVQPWLPGARLQLGGARSAALERLLEYLAFRAEACAASHAELAPLQEMLRVNVQEALGWELPSSVRLELQHPVYADGRLAAEEWIQLPDGPLMKVDAIDHGDDHQFPGPCDSTWDLAGAAIEWRLTAAELVELCARYQRRTGDDVSSRLAPYLLAYGAFRVAQCHNAALSASPEERVRLEQRQHGYLAALRGCAARLGWQESSCASAISC